MFARHCSDEQLLAHLDGEMQWLARLRLKRHLERCWHCRTRLGGLEAEVHTLLRRIDGSPLPTERIAAARQRFFDHPELAEIQFAGEKRVGGRVRLRWLPAAAALALSISAFAWWRLTYTPVHPQQVAAPKVLPSPSPLAVAAHPVPLPSAPHLPAPPRVPAAPPLRAVVSPPLDLDALEVRAHSALHRAHSCLGEGIEVVRTGGTGLVVRGVVQTAARREEIELLLGLLAPSSAIQVQLRTLDELPAKHLENLPPVLEEKTSDSTATIPMEPLLVERYRRMYPDLNAEARERRVVDLSNHVLRLAGVALSHAWALRNFAAAYPPARLSHLSAAELTLAREVIDEHSADLKAACSELAARLEGQIDGGPSETGPAAYPTWQEASAAALEQIRRLHADTSDLFSCCHPIADAQARAARLMRTLQGTRRVAAGIHSTTVTADR